MAESGIESENRGDHWMTRSVLTGVITYGKTREEALEILADANALLARRYQSWWVAGEAKEKP